MANRRHFDADAVIDSAVQQFWSHGFARSSVDDLVRATGLSRSSLYATFGSKEALFEQALQHYDHQVRRRQLEQLEGMASPLAALRALFEGWRRRALEAGDNRGCLLVNTATELRADSPQLQALVAETQRDTEDFLRRMLERGRQQGELPDTLDTVQTARALLAALLGLLVLIRTRPEPDLLRAVTASALAMLLPGQRSSAPPAR